MSTQQFLRRVALRVATYRQQDSFDTDSRRSRNERSTTAQCIVPGSQSEIFGNAMSRAITTTSQARNQ